MRAQAVGGEWFQVALLEQGLARVAIAPDRSDCAPDLYEAEQRGRQKHAGIWALPASAPRAPEAITAADSGSFQIVEGRVDRLNRAGSSLFIDFGGNGKQIFFAVIQPRGPPRFPRLRP